MEKSVLYFLQGTEIRTNVLVFPIQKKRDVL